MRRRSARAGERGTALVEFAFASLFALTLIFGSIEFGRAMYTYDLVANAARLGARFAIVRGSACVARLTPTVCPVATSDVTTYVRGQSTGVGSSQLTVTTTWGGTGSCGAAHPDPGCWVNVSVSFPYHPFFRYPQLTLTSSSQMIISQ